MLNFIKRKLGITFLEDIIVRQSDRIRDLEVYFNSRENCDVCGKHRYTKCPSGPHDA